MAKNNKETRRKWREANKEHIAAYRKKYNQEHPYRKRFNSEGLSYQQLYIKKRREQLISMMGGKCVQCGFSDARALQVDHVNGDGRKDRVNGGSGVSYLCRLYRTNRDALQLLCANCNWIKCIEKREHRWGKSPVDKPDIRQSAVLG